MKRVLSTVILSLWVFCGVGRLALAGEVDILLQKLVEKGVLTGAEAQQVKIETQEQVKKEIATGKSSSLPSWLQRIKLKGDVRLRYQYNHEKADSDYAKDTHRARIRARLGLEAKINEKLLAGVGIATSSAGDPRSTNINFGSNSEKKEIRLDYGYVKYSPLSWLDIVAGKMLLSDVLWQPTDLIWDTDITPEGGVVGFQKDIGTKSAVFAKAGVLIQETDASSNADPMMGYHVQAGATHKVSDDVSLKGALTLYDFSNVKGKTYPTSSWYKSSNTKNGAVWRYDYRMLTPALEIKVKQPFKAVGLGGVESLKVFGEYVNNLAVSDDATGFSFGLQFGNDKIEKWGDWQFKYIYAMLGKDSVLDTLPDSDRYGGKTGMRSHEGIIQFGLGKNTFLGVDVYRSWSIINTRKAPETLVQVDWNVKF